MTDAYIYDAIRTPRGKGRADGKKAADDPFNLETCARATLAIREVRALMRNDWNEMMDKAEDVGEVIKEKAEETKEAVEDAMKE